MINVAQLVKRPKEIDFEIVLSGNFNPDIFDSYWLFKEGFLGEEESTELNHKEFIKGQTRNFSTHFFEVEIIKEAFTISIIDLNHHDLQFDFLLGIIEKLKNSLGEFFSINLRLHYVFAKSRNKNSFLNSLVSNMWNEILETDRSEAYGTRIIEPFNNDEYQMERTLSVSKCFRPDLVHPTHVHTFNQFKVTGSNQIGDVLTHDLVLKTLNKSILITNKLFEKFNPDGIS